MWKWEVEPRSSDHRDKIGRTSGSQLNFVSEGGAVGEDSWIASSCYFSFYILYHGMFLSTKNLCLVTNSKE